MLSLTVPKRGRDGKPGCRKRKRTSFLEQSDNLQDPWPPRAITYDPAKPVTGVVFDLEGRFFERELLPVVITMAEDKSNLTVYSIKNVKPKVIRTYGVVRYADTLDLAKKNPYIGDNALVIPVEAVTKENMIVIGFEGARILKETTRHGNDYLSEAKVIVSAQ